MNTLPAPRGSRRGSRWDEGPSGGAATAPRGPWRARGTVSIVLVAVHFALPAIGMAQEQPPKVLEAEAGQPAIGMEQEQPPKALEAEAGQPAIGMAQEQPPKALEAEPGQPALDAKATSQPAPLAPRAASAEPHLSTAPATIPMVGSSEAAPRLRLTGRLQTLLDLRESRLVAASGDGQVLLSNRTAAAGYLYLAGAADELGSLFNLRGLSLHVNGWAALDLSDVAEGRTRTGDLTYGYLQYQRPGLFDVRLGRQMVFSAGSIPVQIDGASAQAHLPAGLGLQAFAGLTVLPRFGDDRHYILLGDRADDLVKATVREGLDREERVSRGTSWTAGGRVSHRLGNLSDVGVSWMQERQYGVVSREQLGLDATARLHRSVDASGAAILDGTSWKPQELRLRADLYAARALQISPAYSFTDPALFLSRYSVFSVFASEANHDLGLDAAYRVLRRIRLGAGIHQQILLGSEGSGGSYSGTSARYGSAASARADAILGPRDQLLGGVEYRFLHRPENGYHGLRAYGSFQWTPKLSSTAELLLYFYRRAVADLYSPDGARGSSAVYASLTLAYEWQGWRVMANAGASASPLMRSAVFGVAKAEWQLDFASSSARGMSR